MKEYMKPTMLVIMLETEDLVRTSSDWMQSEVGENEDVWQDFYG